MAKLELRITVYTSEKYDVEVAENKRARLKNDRIFPTSGKLAEQVLNAVGGLGYVDRASDCRVLQEVDVTRDVTPASVALPLEKKAAQ